MINRRRMGEKMQTPDVATEDWV